MSRIAVRPNPGKEQIRLSPFPESQNRVLPGIERAQDGGDHDHRERSRGALQRLEAMAQRSGCPREELGVPLGAGPLPRRGGRPNADRCTACSILSGKDQGMRNKSSLIRSSGLRSRRG